MDDDLEMHFECYWEDLQRLAKKHGERVSDRDGWRDPFDEGQTAEQAFYEEYPEHKDGANVQGQPSACGTSYEEPTL